MKTESEVSKATAAQDDLVDEENKLVNAEAAPSLSQIVIPEDKAVSADPMAYARGLKDAAEAMCFACGNYQYKDAVMETKGEYADRWVHRDLDDSARTYCYAGEIRTLIAITQANNDPKITTVPDPGPASSSESDIQLKLAEIRNRRRDNFRELGSDEWRSQYGRDIDYLLSIIDSGSSLVTTTQEAVARHTEVGLNLFRQLVCALRQLDVFACNSGEHDVGCECFWEQCEAWAKADASHSLEANQEADEVLDTETDAAFDEFLRTDPEVQAVLKGKAEPIREWNAGKQED